MATRRLHAVVRGTVQGVSFRAYTQREARRLGLAGWVRNRPSGEVELVAEGEESRLAELERWLQHGPPTAQVVRAEVEYSAASGGLGEFEVRRG